MNQKNCTDMFGTRKQKELYAELKDMVEKALQKMGKEIEDNTQYLETMIDVRVKYLGDVETRLTSLEKRWHLYQNFLWGIVHHIHIPHDEMDKICKQADADWRHIFRGEPVPEIHQFDDEALNFSQPARAKYEAPEAEPALEAEETLFSGLEEYIDSAEARQMLGWKSLSTTMLSRMNIRYQQPKGRYHRLTVHKGDCEKFISNRIVRKKKN